jgi:hypothetical protein
VKRTRIFVVVLEVEAANKGVLVRHFFSSPFYHFAQMPVIWAVLKGYSEISSYPGLSET